MTRAAAASLEARALGVWVGRVPLLDGVDLSIAPGRTLGIVGPNGSGKSTLARCLAGVSPPGRGDILLDGRPLDDLSRRDLAQRLAFVGQETTTDIDYTVDDVVQLGRLPHRSRFGAASAHDLAVVGSALAALGLPDFGRRRWSELSGGERQRVSIARALAQQPAALVLDEPLNHLDVRHQFDLLDLLGALPTTVVVVLHDLVLAARYCDDVLVLDRGRVVASGRPAAVFTPGLIADVFGVHADVTTSDEEVRVELRGSLPLSPSPSPSPSRTM